jgi:hypothetical protein
MKWCVQSIYKVSAIGPTSFKLFSHNRLECFCCCNVHVISQIYHRRNFRNYTTITTFYKLHNTYKNYEMLKHCLAWLGVGNDKLKLMKSNNVLRHFVS